MKSASALAILILCIVGPALLLSSSPATAGEPPAEDIDDIWAKYDRAVVDGVGERSWLFGPAPIGEPIEGTGSATADDSLVQYYDKAQIVAGNDVGGGEPLVLELTSAASDSATTDVADDLLTRISVAGDAGDPNGLTYGIVATLTDHPPFEEGQVLTTWVAADGSKNDDPALARYQVNGQELAVETNHRVASVFWDYLNMAAPVWDGAGYQVEQLFPSPYAATGFPITEAYWLDVAVRNERQDVLLQCFEFRCLTFTPSNPVGWQVESTNTGRHHFDWRSGASDAPDPPGESDLPIATFAAGNGETHLMTLEVAATSATRACGLMHRVDLGTDTGMLFVWEADTAGGFWNCNTFVPLTLAWISADGEIIGLTDMDNQTPGEPQEVVSYAPPGPYRYVIEANRGWFADHGIQVGDTVDLEAALARGDTGSDTLCQELGLACR